VDPNQKKFILGWVVVNHMQIPSSKSSSKQQTHVELAALSGPLKWSVTI